MPRRSIPFLTALIAAAATAGPLLAQGNIITHRPFRPPWRPNRVTTTPLIIKYQRVYTQITDGVAVTTVEQTFRNPLSTQVEGTYVYPLPDGVAVGDFSMTINGKTMHGEVLDKETARRTYEAIVRRTRDPGLLEYMNSRLYQASIFPIPPGKTLDVKLSYTQTLSESAGMGQFRHPLSKNQSAAPPIEQIVIQVKIKSTLPLTSVFCPSHKTDIVRPNDYEATVTYEQSNARPDRDFQLYYQRKDAMFGLSLLTHRAAGEAGYYMLRIAPRIEFDDDKVLPKDIAFVIDTSGSMSGGRIEQVRRALSFCVNSLNPNDRFNIFAFSTDVRPFRESLVSAESDIKSAAVDYAGKLRAVGGTNINAALLAALDADPKDSQRPYLIVFMTDGEATVDVTDPEQIRRNVQSKNTGNVRFHVLGVGTKVNTHLLDKLAEDNRGSRDYCTETEDLELKLSAFVTRLANPVLTDVALKLAGLNTSDQYPRVLPDLFRGNDLVLLGRYEGTGHHRIDFSGRLRGDARSLTYEGEFPKLNSDADFLPRLWANRKVAYLLDQIRLHGSKQELVNEVVRLAKRHGIVTPYTSSLILEDEARLVRRGSGRPIPLATDLIIPERARRVAPRRSSGGAVGRGGRGGSAPMGEGAVADSRTLRDLKSLGYLADSPADDDAFDRNGVASESVIRHAAGKTFVRDGDRWLDTKWDGKKQPKKIKVFSDEYFELLKSRPELSKIFALGARVLVVLGNDVYETVEE